MMGKKLYATAIVATIASAQVFAGQRFSVGPTILLGSGRMNSSALQESLDRRAAMDPEIKEHDVTAWLGYSFGGGATFYWHFAERWEAEVGMIYNYLANTIEQELTADDAHEVLSYRERIESKARFTTMWLQVPLAARFTFSDDKPYYVRAGLALDMFARTEIESEEEITSEDWENGRLVASST
ncbi:MAG: outer membrane beta-barrel protein, partial [Chitinivibrionales bacterium]|nr:outer membrane beta-barrel protein [Chitinivibrionales bacterium]